MVLRYYQLDLLNRIYGSINSGNQNVIGQLPPGGGKSCVFSELIRIERLERDKRILFVAGRQELLNQAAFHFWNVGIPSSQVGFIRPGNPYNPGCPVQVASIDTLRSRKQFPAVDWVVVDEAHHCKAKSYQPLFEIYKNAKIVGFTATPIRTNGEGFNDLFQDLQCGPSVASLIAQGYLSNYEIYEGESPSTEGLKIKSGDYDEQELGDRAKEPRLVGNLVESWTEHVRNKVGDRRTVVFSIDCEHSDLIAEAYNQAGIPAVVVHGKMSTSERKRVLSGFLSGKYLILVNTDILAEGFDLSTYARLSNLPEVDIGCVQLARPTLSLIVYLQQVGRCLRPAPEKEFAIILDHAGNRQRHKDPDEPREWSLFGTRKKKRERSEILSTKDCLVCGEENIPIRARICPNELCQCRFTEKNLETDDSVKLVKVNLNPVSRLRRYLAEGDAPLFALAKFLQFELTLQELIVGGRYLGYSDPLWAWDVWRERNPGKLDELILREHGKILQKNWLWLREYSEGRDYSEGCSIECFVGSSPALSLWVPARFVKISPAYIYAKTASGELLKLRPECVRLTANAPKQLQLF